MTKQLHKDTKEENIITIKNGDRIIKVLPNSISELKYYMDYGDGYSKEIYEKVLNTENPLYFMIDDIGIRSPFDSIELKNNTSTLMYYYDDDTLYLSIRFNGEGKLKKILGELNMDVDKVCEDMVESWNRMMDRKSEAVKTNGNLTYILLMNSLNFSLGYN